MQDWTSDELKALRKLIERAQLDPGFTEEDMQALRKVADTIRGLSALGRISKWLIFILAATAGAVTAWDTLMVKVRLWLGS